MGPPETINQPDETLGWSKRTSSSVRRKTAEYDVDLVTNGPIVSSNLETSLPGVFACGNVLHVHDLADFVTEELDGGPVIAQAEVAVAPDDTAESLAEKVQEKEHILYPIVVRWFCEGRIQLGSDYVLFDGELLKQPMRLPDN